MEASKDPSKEDLAAILIPALLNILSEIIMQRKVIFNPSHFLISTYLITIFINITFFITIILLLYFITSIIIHMVIK
jgi:hypothetical protein